ncbi:MAG: SpoIIE family protein phosphatase [Pyrinomonadaceae bacterium]
MNTEASIYLWSIGFASAMALLHLFLYLFYPRQRANLFFSLLAFAIAVRSFTSDILHTSDYGLSAPLIRGLMFNYSVALAAFSFALFLYAAFALPIPKHFWIVLAAWAMFAIWRTIDPSVSRIVLLKLILPVFVIIESLRIIIRALIRKLDGAWIIGLGVLLVAFAPMKEAYVMVTHEQVSVFWNTLINQFAICGIIIANSVFLARNFARTNKNLEAQLVQVRELSERELEHVRTAAELRLQNEQERARLALVEQELALAASIQQELFPQKMPDIKGYDVAAHSRPARVCGGDYYDALAISSNGDDKSSHYLFCVADVSGKGLPAALLMSNMQASLRALAGRAASLVELATRTSELLYDASPANKFVTAILLDVDTQTGICRYVNAGHNECIVRRADGSESELLKSTGLPLGMLPGSAYEELSFKLKAGDVLALYSDGVTEAYDKDEQEWGEARLLESLSAAAAEPAQKVVSNIFEEIDRFADGTPQHDDITLLILKPTAIQDSV